MEKINQTTKTLGFKFKAHDLEKEFDKALKEDGFKSFLEKINLPKEELMKYTSTLTECFKEYSNCKKCKSIMECQNNVEGHAYLPKIINGKLKFIYKPCKYIEKIKKLINENKYLENITTINISSNTKDANFDELYKNDKNRLEAIKFVTTFYKEYKKGIAKKGAYLYGNNGSGKTYIIASLLHELAKDNHESAILFWPEFLNDLKATMNENYGVTYKRKLDFVKNVPILFIDDIGAENSTPWSRDEILCPILQERMDNKLPTFFTSNLNIDELHEHLSMTRNSINEVKSKRIIERIKAISIPIKMESENLRNK